MKRLFSLLLVCLLLLCGCAEKNAAESTAATTGTEAVSGVSFSDRDYEVGYDEAECVHITLTGDGAQCDSDAVTISAGAITVREAGDYLVSGTLNDGMLIVEAGESDKVRLILDGVALTSATSAAIYVRSADKVFLTTAVGSENVLANGGSYQAIDENNIDAVIFSKADLTMNGEGGMEINAAAGHGVVSKDELTVTSGSYTIQAEKHGLCGKDGAGIAGGSFTVSCGKDGVHSDGALVITGGTLDITQSYEGIEGQTVEISGGTVSINASDDGINAASPDESSDFRSDANAYIHISGGTVNIRAEGDGIDSNGSLLVSGGEVYISGPTSGGNGSLDYAGSGTITGGVVVAVGSAQMAQNFGADSTQGAILLNVGRQQAGTAVSLAGSDGTTLVSYTAQCEYECVIVSAPEIRQGETYTVTAGETNQTVTMDSLIYGGGMGMPGGFGGHGGGGFGGGGFGGERPDKGGDRTPPNGEMPSGDMTPPNGEMPSGDMMPPDGEMPSDGMTGATPDAPEGNV